MGIHQLGVSYEIWSRTSGNLIGVFASEAEALQMVRDIAQADGLAEVESLSLGEVDEDGHDLDVVFGHELVALADRLNAEEK